MVSLLADAYEQDPDPDPPIQADLWPFLSGDVREALIRGWPKLWTLNRACFIGRLSSCMSVPRRGLHGRYNTFAKLLSFEPNAALIRAPHRRALKQ